MSVEGTSEKRPHVERSLGRLVGGGTYEIAMVQFRALQIFGTVWIHLPKIMHPKPRNIFGWVRVRNNLGCFTPNIADQRTRMTDA